MALTDKSKRVNYVISCAGASADDLAILSADIKKALEDLGAIQYAYILHQKDIKDDGTLKTPHFHIVAEYASTKRLNTFLTNMADALGMNVLSIGVEKCRSFEGSFQYLVHKNDSDKYQYDPNSIISNLTEEVFEVYMNAEPDELSMDRLIYLCETLKRPIAVARSIGLGRYQVYRKVIQDIFDDLNRQRYAKRYEQ